MTRYVDGLVADDLWVELQYVPAPGGGRFPHFDRVFDTIMIIEYRVTPEPGNGRTRIDFRNASGGVNVTLDYIAFGTGRLVAPIAGNGLITWDGGVLTISKPGAGGSTDLDDIIFRSGTIIPPIIAEDHVDVGALPSGAEEVYRYRFWWQGFDGNETFRVWPRVLDVPLPPGDYRPFIVANVKCQSIWNNYGGQEWSPLATYAVGTQAGGDRFPGYRHAQWEILQNPRRVRFYIYQGGSASAFNPSNPVAEFNHKVTGGSPRVFGTTAVQTDLRYYIFGLPLDP